jgi:AcrR family transcriptional regulator
MGLHHDGRVTDPTANEPPGAEDPEAGAGHEPVDGRTARRDRNRVAVLDAALELFSEGHLSPTAPQVAERSGVSLRSVYRYFEDREGLLHAAIDHHSARVVPLLELPGLAEGPLEERIERIVAARLRLYRAIADLARVAVVRAVSNEAIRKLMEERRTRLSQQVDAQFAPELDLLPRAERRRRAAALDLLLSVEGIEYVCTRRDVGDDELPDVLGGNVRDVLT